MFAYGTAMCDCRSINRYGIWRDTFKIFFFSVFLLRVLRVSVVN